MSRFMGVFRAHRTNYNGGPIGSGSQRLFWGVGNHAAISVAGLGNGKEDWDSLEMIDGVKENVRIAAAAGANALLANKITEIEVEDLGCARSAAEGSVLASYKFQDFKAEDKRKPEGAVNFAAGADDNSSWAYGKHLAENQNWARKLANTAANLMTPTIFAEAVRDNMPSSVNVIAHDKAWAAQQKMGSYLSVAQGSDQPPVFLELTYNGTGGSVDGKQPICLVGKGITFDSGGISLKPSLKMDAMRGDMTGAAIVVGTIKALADTQANVYVKGFVPLTENLPSGSATKPGDIVTARSGTTICVDNTDAEGRLVLADALDYAKDFNPKFIVDVATLTGACSVALGDCIAGAFVNNDDLWQKLEAAGSLTGDRVWRLPLMKHYTKCVTDYEAYDLNNIGNQKGGGACTAAAFLREFVPKQTPWAHLDIAPVMADTTDQCYTSKGMSARPMRTLYELVVSSK